MTRLTLTTLVHRSEAEMHRGVSRRGNLERKAIIKDEKAIAANKTIIETRLFLVAYGGDYHAPLRSARNDGKGAISIFSLFEAVIHLVLTGKSLTAFGDMGQTAFYSPGLNTALFMFLPLAITYSLYFIFHKTKPNWKQWLGGILSLVGLSFLLVNLPEMLLKNENSPYVFPSHGYYDQFINGTATSGMSGATIATIIIGGLLVCGIIGLCIYYFAIKKKI